MVMKKENDVNHKICMEDKNRKDSVCHPTNEEIKAEIDLINPDENTLDRG